jgi:hypothetical protein
MEKRNKLFFKYDRNENNGIEMIHRVSRSYILCVSKSNCRRLSAFTTIIIMFLELAITKRAILVAT